MHVYRTSTESTGLKVTFTKFACGTKNARTPYRHISSKTLVLHRVTLCRTFPNRIDYDLS